MRNNNNTAVEERLELFWSQQLTVASDGGSTQTKVDCTRDLATARHRGLAATPPDEHKAGTEEREGAAITARGGRPRPGRRPFEAVLTRSIAEY